MWVLQISDLHFTKPYPDALSTEEFLKLMRDQVAEFVPDDAALAVALCGDVTYQGNTNGYDQAGTFLQRFAERFSWDVSFWPCPGNHDVVASDRPFNSFNRFAWTLTEEDLFTFNSDKTCVRGTAEDADMILVNSSYHRSHTYGLVHTAHLQNVLAETDKPTRLIIVHHHSIPVREDDVSAIRNSFPFLHLAARSGVTAVLHGHRHMQTILAVGQSRCKMIGVGSLLFPPSANVNNQFNLLEFASGSLRSAYHFTFVRDLGTKAGVVGFQRTQLAVI